MSDSSPPTPASQSSPESPASPATPKASTMELKLKRKHTCIRIRRKHVVPEIGSLYDILHDHATTSLFILPLCWTNLHIQLLGCRFTQLPAQETPTPTPSKSSRRATPPTVLNMSRDLNTLISTELDRPLLQTRAMKDVLSTLFPTHLSRARTCVDLGIRFGPRWHHRAVRCQAVWKHPDSSSTSFDSASTLSNRSVDQSTASMNVNGGNVS